MRRPQREETGYVRDFDYDQNDVWFIGETRLFLLVDDSMNILVWEATKQTSVRLFIDDSTMCVVHQTWKHSIKV